ncbi:DUF4350 domain-containing protein [Nocardioides marmoriginsengisoli]|uniref:DUF4350 domain-containing protein n=1 Tax=Nocardioides marmoriginsengisoli TaxID=661483 RepID=A0A3N0CCH8_9ACTN|nr:DUF4350 domain-containing protein [Nocardioides marmoriginsengisoli]RNL61152.1 DUF4350 domain-containing protein [Nocardioides marmoriginsengisoli]
MTATATSPVATSWVRRYRALLIVGAGFVAAIVFAALGTGGTHGGVADPGNADPEGARALAQVLGDQGVDVRVVRSADDLDRTTADADTTVVVTGTEDLGESTVRRLLDHARDADVIVVEPRYGAAQLFGVDRSGSVLDGVSVVASCTDSRLEGLRIEVEAATGYAGDGGCFPAGEGALMVSPSPGVTLLGSTDLISNEQITQADNAAIALRLFGQHDRLVWYVPSLSDLDGADGVSLGSLLPRWLRPALLLGAVAMLSVLWWRGRRLGRLATEPLPVAVTAIETTLSRGRLYRKVNDRAYAAAALRSAARRRVAESLNLPRGAVTDVDGLVRDVAAHTALDHARVRELLADGPAPSSDHDLTHLANDLADLMREVRRR